MLTIVPFSGFYGSSHEGLLDHAEERLFQNEDGDPNPGLSERFLWICNHRQVYERYARAYLKEFARHFDLRLEFDELNSPRFYDFTTDRIFARIPRSEVRRLRREVDEDALTEEAADWFTSCSGFISYYSPNWGTWGPLDKWDHNQVGCLLAAWTRQHEGHAFNDRRQAELMKDYDGNGDFDNWLYEAAEGPELRRIGRVYAYLRQREERKWRHAA